MVTGIIGLIVYGGIMFLLGFLKWLAVVKWVIRN